MNTPKHQDIIIPIKGIELHGILSVPKNSIGIVIFSHGHGSSRLSPRNTYVAKTLQSKGIATLLIDLLTESEDETSENRFDIDLITERLLRITQWINGFHDTNTLSVAYFGASTGAAAALKAATTEKVFAVVSRGGRPDLVTNFLEKVIAPTLLIVGGKDKVVQQLNQEAFQKLSCEKNLRIISGASHLFQESGKLEQVSQLATDWFFKWLKESEHVVQR